MSLQMYTCTSDNRCIDKSKTAIGSPISCSFKDDTTMENPAVIISPDAYSAACNYVYLDDTSRFYYVTDVTFSQQRCILHLKVDVLMSFAAEIKLSKCIAARSSSSFNMYVNDERYNALEYSNVFTKPFPNSFSKSLEYVLIVGG